MLQPQTKKNKIFAGRIKMQYVVPISIVVRNLVTSLRSILKTPFSDSLSANSRTCLKFFLKKKLLQLDYLNCSGKNWKGDNQSADKLYYRRLVFDVPCQAGFIHVHS